MAIDLETAYRARYANVLVHLATNLEGHLQELVEPLPRIDRIQTRAKSPERFLAKASKVEEGVPKYEAPLSDIQDQVGARIVTFYISDVETVCSRIERYFHHIEKKKVVPESEAEFGYFGFHYIVGIPTDALDSAWSSNDLPEFFELQIKTLFQHAWSEANHDLGYKELGQPLTSDDKRRMAWASAQAWGADQIFEDLFRTRGGA